MSVRYYRFSQPAVLATAKSYIDDCGLLNEQISVLVKEFGGRSIVANNVHGRRFAGLVFSPAKDAALWTKPDRQCMGTQRPRSKVPAAQRDALAELTERWTALQPTIHPSLDALLTACGTDWGNLLFGGFGYKLTDHAVCIATSLDLSASGEEITGGDYEAAARAVQP